jgi:hypothetical protein
MYKENAVERRVSASQFIVGTQPAEWLALTALIIGEPNSNPIIKQL